MLDALDAAHRQGHAETLQTIIDFLPSGMMRSDPSLQMIACNELFKRLLDFPGEMFDKGLPTIRDLAAFNARRGDYGPGAREVLTQQVVERARLMQPHVYERTRPNGTVLEIRGTSLPDGRGFVSRYTDITERIRNEKLIRQVKNLMSDAINFSPTYIWETNDEGRYTFRQGVEKILGYGASELLGRCRCECFGFTPETTKSMCDTTLARSPFNQNVIGANNRSGELVWLSSSAQAVFDEQGEFVGYRGVDVDVTELTQARQELEQMALHDSLTGLSSSSATNLKCCASSAAANRLSCY